MKKAMSVILSVFLIFGIIPLSTVSADLSEGDYNYVLLSDGTAKITGYTGVGGKLILPDKLDGKAVTAIGDEAFRSCSGIKNLTIPDSVTTIGDEAFFSCSNLESITMGKGLTDIGRDAFRETPYYSAAWNSGALYFGEYLIKISTYAANSYAVKQGTRIIASSAFFGCSSLKGVSIPDSVTHIGSDAFSDCTALTGVTFGSGVKVIGDRAFSSCGLERVTLPDSVTTIGNEAFYGCEKLAGVTIGSRLTELGNDVFAWSCKLESITIDAANAKFCSDGGVLFNKDKTTLTAYPAGNDRTAYVIPDGVTVIGKAAFKACETLESVTMPSSVATVGEYAFLGCELIKSVLIPVGVTTIGDCAFGFNESSSGYEVIPDFEIRGKSGTEAEKYATDNSIKFVACEHDYIGEITGRPSCSRAGSQVFICLICFDSYDRDVPKAAHTPVTDSAVAASCVKVGLTEGSHCSVCDEVITAQAEIPAAGHDFKWDTVKKTTYFAAGKAQQKCAVCGELGKMKAIKKLRLKRPAIKLTAGNGKITVSYGRVKGAKKYVIYVKVGKKWVKNATVKKLRCTVKGLEAGKKYSIRVRAVVMSGKKSVYSAYSKVKRAKAK